VPIALACQSVASKSGLSRSDKWAGITSIPRFVSDRFHEQTIGSEQFLSLSSESDHAHAELFNREMQILNCTTFWSTSHSAFGELATAMCRKTGARALLNSFSISHYHPRFHAVAVPAAGLAYAPKSLTNAFWRTKNQLFLGHFATGSKLRVTTFHGVLTLRQCRVAVCVSRAGRAFPPGAQ